VFPRLVWPPTQGTQHSTVHGGFEVVDLEAALAHAVELGGDGRGLPAQDNLRVILDPAGPPCKHGRQLTRNGTVTASL
jgi:hypothetical protein